MRNFILFLFLLLFSSTQYSFGQYAFEQVRSYNTYLTAGLKVRLAGNSSCSGAWVPPDCGYTYDSYSLQIEVSLNEDIEQRIITSPDPNYNPTCELTIRPEFKNSCFPTAPIFNLNTYPNGIAPLSTINFVLNKSQPRALYTLDINSFTKDLSTSQFINELFFGAFISSQNQYSNNSDYFLDLPITVFTSNQVDYDQLKIRARILPHRVSGYHLSSPSMGVTAVQNSATKKVDFYLPGVCNNVLYQIQVLRLFNSSTTLSNSTNIEVNTSSLNWSNALNVYTTNPSLTLAEGTGFYAWRYRIVHSKYSTNESDPRNWETWVQNSNFDISNPSAPPSVTLSSTTTTPFVFYYTQFDDEKNWYYTRNMIEGSGPFGMKQNLIGESMTYANGLGMVRQHQSISNTNQTVMVANEFQDYVGRTALKTLSAAVNNHNFLGYVQGFTGTYSVAQFDENNNYKNTEDMTSSLLSDFYSNANTDIDIPNADGYPFTRIRFGRNSQNEVVETSMPGDAHRIKTSGIKHTNRNLIGGIADIELVRIFGDEAPPAAKVLKRVSIDPNGEKNVTYMDLTGKVWATCLSSNPSEVLQPLTSVPNPGFLTVETLGPPRMTGQSMVSILLAEPTALTFKYEIDEQTYADACANLCQTCDYHVSFTLVNEENPEVILWEGEAIIDPDQTTCATSSNLGYHTVDIIHNNVPAPSHTYTTSEAGKYLFRKVVKSYNTNTALNQTYLDINSEALQQQLEQYYENPNLSIQNWEVWDGVTNQPEVVGGIPLKINLKDFKTKLLNKVMKSDPTNNIVGVYELLNVPTSTEATFKRILKLNDLTNPSCNAEIAFDIQSCPIQYCTDKESFVNNLLDDLFTRLTSSSVEDHNNALSNFDLPSSPNTVKYNDVFRIYSAFFNVGSGNGPLSPIQSTLTYDQYIRVGRDGMKRIILNMLTDTDVFTTQSTSNILMTYSCEDVYNAFQHAANVLIEFYSDDAALSRQNNKITTEPDFINDFLLAAGYKLTCGTDEQGDLSLSANNVKGFLSTPYRCFKYSNDMTSIHNWATTAILNSSPPELQGIAGLVLFHNGMYNLELPGTCTATIPVNSPGTTYSVNSSFNPNLSYFNSTSSGTSLTFPTPCYTPGGVPEMPTDILLGAKQATRIAASQSNLTNLFQLPDVYSEDEMKSYASKLEAQCMDLCNGRYHEVSIGVSEEFLDHNVYGSVSIEGYKSGILSSTQTYLSNNYPINLKDAYVEGIMQGCKSKCRLEVVSVPSSSPTIFRIKEENLNELTKVLALDMEVIFKPIHNELTCTNCLDINGNPAVFSNSTSCDDNTIASNFLTMLANIDHQFQLLGDLYRTCCDNTKAHKDVTKYPLENADPRLPKEYARVLSLNSDFMSSSLETMLRFLNSKVNDKLQAGYSKYDMYNDIISYLSPIQYPGGSILYDPLVRASQTPPGKSVTTNGGLLEEVFNLAIDRNTMSDAHFSIGQKKKVIFTAGSNEYVIERETQDILPFHVNMPVRLTIYPHSSVSTSSFPKVMEFEEILNDYNSPGSSAPELAFATELSSLIFKHEFLKKEDTFRVNYTVRVQHDYHNPDAESKNLTNADIDGAFNQNAIPLALLPLPSNTPANFGRPVVYSEFRFKSAATYPNLATASTMSLSTSGANSTILLPLGSGNPLGVVFIPYLRTFSNTEIPGNQSIANNTDIDYLNSYTLSIPTVPPPSPTMSMINPGLNTGGTKNAVVQIAPMYFSYTDNNGVFQQQYQMTLSNYKVMNHNRYCLQFFPYELDSVEVDVDRYVTCEEAEALNLYDAISSSIATLYNDRLLRFKDSYHTNCSLNDNIKDHCTVEYVQGLHHYTLYYYDRAGNLVRTVPPEGITSFMTSRASHPNHNLVTEYNYNSLGQIESQHTPDGGTTKFWYDQLSRIRFSQNSKQLPLNQYSFTNYDNLGRVVKVGQIASMSMSTLYAELNNPMWPGVLPNITDVVSTSYTEPLIIDGIPVIYCNSNSVQNNLLNRISYTISDADGNSATVLDNVITFYSYDVHGNVEWLGSKMADMPMSFVRYEYDLISGAVLQVATNECDHDAIFHKYEYDTDKRLLNVFTSHDGLLWDKDAHYGYYNYGPLRSVVIGQDKLQKNDYAYTINGWLKGINHLSKDNAATTQSGTPFPIKDLFAMKLHYFNRDFERSNGNTVSAFNYIDGGDASLGYNLSIGMDNVFGGMTSTGAHLDGLYNGNIRGIFTATTSPLKAGSTAGTQSYLYAHAYEYDELNRLIQTRFFEGTSSTDWKLTGQGNRYRETFEYDANGNIRFANRYDGDAHRFDSLEYKYNLVSGKIVNNKLGWVNDRLAISPHAATYDIKQGQVTGNYTYDALGNLTRDNQEDLVVKWNNFGKVSEIIKEDKKKIQYLYDATGNRVAKRTFDKPVGSQNYPILPQNEEYYMRDATGNILSTFHRTNNEVAANNWQTQIKVTEQPLYGSDRLGVFTHTQLLKYPLNAVSNLGTYSYPEAQEIANERQLVYRPAGNKRYELKDHLGNVRSTFTDELITLTVPLANTCAANTDCDFVAGSSLQAYPKALYNYYAFGMPMPNEVDNQIITYANWVEENNVNYRFGFNGQEKLNEVSGEGNTLDLGARIYSSRLGKMFSPDPLEALYPWQTTYAYFGNSPIAQLDYNGEGDYYGTNGKYLGTDDKKDDKAYMAKSLVIKQREKKDSEGNVMKDGDGNPIMEDYKVFEGARLLSISHSEFRKQAGTVYGESSAYKTNGATEELAMEMGAIAYVHQTNKIAFAGSDGNEQVALFNNTGLENQSDKMRLANWSILNAVTGGFDYSYGATNWDGIEQARFGDDDKRYSTGGKRSWELHKNTIGWKITNAHYIKWQSYANAHGFAFKAPATSLSVAGTYGRRKIKGGLTGFQSTAVYGGTIFWKPNK